MAATSTETASSSTGAVTGRDRSSSDAAAAHNVADDPRPPEAVHLPRSASYTYFPPVKDLEYEDSSVVELKGRISEAELRSSRDEEDSPYSSSGGSTPENEPANEPDAKRPQPANPPPHTSRISRFFSATRDPLNLGSQAKEEKQKDKEKDTPKEAQKEPSKEVPKQSQRLQRQTPKEGQKQQETRKSPRTDAPQQTQKAVQRESRSSPQRESRPSSRKENKPGTQKETQRSTQQEPDREKEKEKTSKSDADQQAVPPKRSLTHLRRKSWVPSSGKESSPSKAPEEEVVNGSRPSPEKRRSFISSRRKSILRKDSDPPAIDEERPPPPTSRRKSFIRKDSEGSPTPNERPSNRMSRRMSILRKDSDKKDSDSPSGDDSATKSPKKGGVLTKRPRKPSDAYIRPVKTEDLPPMPTMPELPKSPAAPKSPSIPKSPSMPSSPQLGQSFSTDRLPMLVRSPPSQDSIPPMPRPVNQEKLKTFSLETPKKKDELWNQFRSLDGDFQKFSSKSIALKANVVRQSLLPFLRTYASHPSNSKIRPEDLDRRSNILNKWWTGLLEMINGKNNQSISGSDRPHILQAIVGVMERPEWRAHPSPYAPLTERNAPSLPRSHSSTSLASAESDFLADSVNHNVRNTFIQNLTAQMAFAIEKMSLRNAPASLVTFCGKTCAYAFFFCPGMADILVRLWSPSLDAMRRVMAECKMSDRTKLDETSKRILPAFPPHMQPLGFTNLHKTFRELRKPAPFPLGTSTLPWHGSWVKRWCGTESDLFYVFTKCYHILITDFLPAATTRAERLCVPGLVMVHAQILTNMDETLHRHAAITAPKDEESHAATAVTFDDVLADGPDAAASALPIPPANAVRLMAENRLIMLLRDFLSAGSAHLPTAPHIFAESFSCLLQASARRVSMYDHNASYTLCDFLEEALSILLRYERTYENKPVLDWSFWISVYKRMTESHNTTTEIRLISFLYSIWSTLVEDEKRKEELCLDFLLEPKYFESRFNHWCPMLRAYYMRLLCWRITRFDGEATDYDVKIFKVVEERLQSVWSHYLYLQEMAQTRSEPLPSTTPCNPAPGRRLLIIRHDAPLSPANGPFLSFDGIVSNSPKNQATAYNSHSALEKQLGDTNIRPSSALSIASDNSDPDEENGKKRWGLLRSLLSVPKSRAKSRSPDPPTSRQGDQSSSENGSSTAESGKTKVTNTPEVPPHRSYCFRFSLEWVHDKRFANPGPMRLLPPRLPPAAHNYLISHRDESEAANPKPITSVRPEGPAVTTSKYSGRALGEWAIVVGECQSFFQRRKDEGVPNNKLVETPTLGVEVFRRPG